MMTLSELQALLMALLVLIALHLSLFPPESWRVKLRLSKLAFGTLLLSLYFVGIAYACLKGF